MSVKSLDKLQKVMNSHLCNRCGSCVGLSDGKIIFTDRVGKYIPVIKDKISEDEADRIWTACAGQEFNFPKYNKIFFNNSIHYNIYTGSFNNIYIAHANDEGVRKNSASGGIISAILIYLLEKGIINGVITLGMSHSEPWLTKPFIATTKEEILEGAQSKYIISSVNEILSESASFKGKLAYVGLPGQVQSVRKLQAAGDPSVANIEYVFGPFYGNTLHFSSVRSFLKSNGEKDYRNILKLYFRHGEWPGNMRVELKNGRIIELKKFHANYLIPFHILRNSLYCTDLSNEFTDISGGDAWAPEYELRGKGFSMMISRTTKGQKIIDEMTKEGRINITTLTVDEAIKMHSHGYDLKKRGAFIRIKFRKLLGKSIPHYGYEIKGFPVSRYFMEVIISTMFIVLSTRISRFVIEQFSPAFVGGVFEKARNIWKKSTYKVKREAL